MIRKGIDGVNGFPHWSNITDLTFFKLKYLQHKNPGETRAEAIRAFHICK